MTNLFARFYNDEDGATAIEYGLIAALIGIGIIVAARALGTQISATFGEITTELAGAGVGGEGGEGGEE